jgi:hypothetical protein
MQQNAAAFGGADAGPGPDHGRGARSAKSSKDPLHLKAAAPGGACAGLGPDHGREAGVAKSGENHMQLKTVKPGGVDAGVGPDHGREARIAKSGNDPLQLRTVKPGGVDADPGPDHLPPVVIHRRSSAASGSNCRLKSKASRQQPAAADSVACPTIRWPILGRATTTPPDRRRVGRLARTQPNTSILSLEETSA